MTLEAMKRLALGLLAAMLALTAACVVLEPRWPPLAWVRAFAEAAAVGALADWFAVTALFRHPLGLAIPHTAVIPRNKDRIGASLGAFVEENFLTPRHVIARLAREQLARAAATWLADAGNRRRVASGACTLLAWTLRRLGDEDARRFLDRLLTAQLRRLAAAPLAGQVLDLLTVEGRHQALLDHGLRALDGWLQANRGLIRAKVREGSVFMPGFVDDYIADRFVDGLLALLHEAANDPAHEVRERFDTALRDGIHALQHSPRWRRRGAAALRLLAAHVRREQYDVQLWHALRRRLDDDLASDAPALRAHLEDALESVGHALAQDTAMQRKLDAWALEAAEALLLRHRHHVAALITEVVRSWDASEVSGKVEAEIGRDLQFIRINGTVVGGAAGLGLHALGRLLA